LRGGNGVNHPSYGRGLPDRRAEIQGRGRIVEKRGKPKKEIPSGQTGQKGKNVSKGWTANTSGIHYSAKENAHSKGEPFGGQKTPRENMKKRDQDSGKKEDLSQYPPLTGQRGKTSWLRINIPLRGAEANVTRP